MAAHCKDKFRSFWRRFQSNLKTNRFPVELGEAGSVRRAAEVERITSKQTPPIDIRLRKRRAPFESPGVGWLDAFLSRKIFSGTRLFFSLHFAVFL